MTIALWVGAASAADIDLLVLDTFPAALTPANGWHGGYAPDAWTGGSAAHPLTDDGGDADTYGTGGAADNWMVSTAIAAMGEGGVAATIASVENDTVGLVHSLSPAGDTAYLAFWCGDQCAPGAIDSQEHVWLIRLEGGVVTEAVSQPTFLGGVFGTHLLALVRDANHVVVALDGAVLLDVLDPTPLAPGDAGFYAYQSGGCAAGCLATFDDLRIWAHDQDDDAVADDTDNCPADPNPDQADDNTNGVGDACDTVPDDGSDSDSDGLSDVVEADLGTNPDVGDSDFDGIPDATEVGDPGDPPDSDDDGLIDALDDDDDGDGIPSRDEGPSDFDADGLANYLDTDSDGDGASDGAEGSDDADGDSQPDFLDPGGVPVSRAPAETDYGYGWGCASAPLGGSSAAWLGLVWLARRRR